MLDDLNHFTGRETLSVVADSLLLELGFLFFLGLVLGHNSWPLASQCGAFLLQLLFGVRKNVTGRPTRVSGLKPFKLPTFTVD